MIDFTWEGKKYTIPEDRLFEVGEALENIIPMDALPRMARSPNFRTLARAYSAVLKAVDIDAPPRKVHEQMMASEETLKRAGDMMATIVRCITDGMPTTTQDDAKKEDDPQPDP